MTNQHELTGLLHRLQELAQAILELTPRVERGLAADPGLDDLRAAAELARRHPAWSQFTAKCREIAVWKYPVAALFGPSGAGKSTFFRALTGLEVPTSPALRPTTFASLAAAPPDLDATLAAKMFAGFDLAQAPADKAGLDQLLTRRDTPADRLYLAYPPGRALPFVLVDVPDFNTVERANRDKAEAVARRAEAILFLVYKEGYADEQTADMLLFCCQRAAHLAYVLTKATAAEARVIWPDLLAKMARREEFAAARPDGRTALQFLSQVSPYYSPPLTGGGDPGAEPLEPGAPPLADSLQSRSPQRLQLSTLSGALAAGLGVGRRLIDEAADLNRRLETAHQVLEEALDREFDGGYPLEFPVGDLLATLSDLAHEHLKRAGVASRALYWLNWPGRAAAKQIRARLSAKKDDLSKLAGAEAESLGRIAAGLAKSWRIAALGEPTLYGRFARLDEPAIQAALDDLGQCELPPIPPEWEGVLAGICERWIADNPTKARTLALISGTITGVMGGVFATADVLLGGPLTTTLLTAPVGAAVGQLLGQLIEDYQLEQAVREAAGRWQERRVEQLAAHLTEHFARPLWLDTWRRCRDQLAELPLAELGSTLKSLDGELTLLAPFAAAGEPPAFKESP